MTRSAIRSRISTVIRPGTLPGDTEVRSRSRSVIMGPLMLDIMY